LRQYRTGKTFSQVNKKGKFQMATAKKAAPKAAASPKKVSAPAKVVKPVVKAPAKKAPVSKAAKAIAKISASIAKLTERKDKLNTEINTLRAQRAALKVVPAAAAPSAAPMTKVAPLMRDKKSRG
jgi:acyl CoA:acetate/3-ketoacid CoA transferase